MMKAAKILLAGVIGLSSTAALIAPSRADEFTCRGNLGNTTVDNLRVPEDATCTLNGTRVEATSRWNRGRC
jgi:hypothetical protein